MKIAIGSDHAGFALKAELIAFLRQFNHEVVDLGCYDEKPVDYPDFAAKVGHSVVRKEVERGVVIRGSGVGANVAANKIKGVRAAVCHDTYSAHQGVEHDDMNVLVLGSRIIGLELAKEIILAFLAAQFSKEERHMRRLQKVLDLETQWGHG
jgi:RpiB/LacA/LacB family sugar-phosphate isomerase